MSYMVAQRELFGVTHYSIQVNSVKLNVSIAICCRHSSYVNLVIFCFNWFALETGISRQMMYIGQN